MTNRNYPDLYDVADAASNAQQRLYLNLIRIEYSALFAASILTVEIIKEAWYIIIYGVILAIAAGASIYRHVKSPERAWYQARALAESVKTSAWKYAMRSKPFDTADDHLDRANYRNFLRDLLDANKHIGDQFSGFSQGGDQITEVMQRIRSLSIRTRLKFYLKNRVNDQRIWYVKKSSFNKKRSRLFFGIIIFMYIISFIALLIRVSRPEWSFSHPDPIILLATAIIGWMQIKKFNELSASYNLTAIEIGILKTRVPEIETEDHLSNFVDDAEEAFSREHTQWLARRSHG